jgi:hypothetical protein
MGRIPLVVSRFVLHYYKNIETLIIFYKIAKISTLGMCRNQSMNFQVVSQSMKSGSLENAMPESTKRVVAITVAPPRKALR